MRTVKLLSLPVLVLSQTGCIVVGGYTSDGGWYFWPGSLVITLVVLALLWLLTRGRRRRM